MRRRVKKMRGRYMPSTIELADGTHKTYKVCSFCGDVKPLDEFPRNGKDASGVIKYRDDCKKCYNIRRRENATKKKHTDFVGSMKRRGESDIDYTHQQWKEAVIYFGGECCYCGRTMRKGERLTKDHLVPVSTGGRTVQSNIVPACQSCNSSKGAEDFRDWFMKQPFFSQERLNKIFKWRTIIRQLEGGAFDG